MKHLYIVKKEVRADSIEEAVHVRGGKIYEVTLAEDKYQPEYKSQILQQQIGYGK